jgi:hypothetical protein
MCKVLQWATCTTENEQQHIDKQVNFDSAHHHYTKAENSAHTIAVQTIIAHIIDIQTTDVHSCAAQTNSLTFLMLSLLSPLKLTVKNGLVLSTQLPYFPARKTHFFSRKMWPKFDLRLMRRGYVLFPNL